MRLRFALSLVPMVMWLAACGGGDVQPAEPGSPARPTAAAATTWLAAVDVAPRADDLDAATERLKDPLGTALVVSPTDCFEGLPSDAGEGYVIGAVGRSPEQVEGLVAEAGETVLFTAPVTILCTD
jgi:hypothetical protein